MFSLFFILMALKPDPLVVTSTAFKNNEAIPIRYTCEGESISPPLKIEGVPESAKSLVLIVEDPDTTGGGGIHDHWVMWNIAPTAKTTVIEANTTPGIQGLNGDGNHNYAAPCPPAKSVVHYYYFRVYALDKELDLKEQDGRRKSLEAAMDGHILAQGQLVGTYERKHDTFAPERKKKPN